MEASRNASAADSFELQAKADEWMDVTPKEEVLRAELTRLQEAFEKCTSQLDSSRLENDLLRDRGNALEHETKDLRSLLERTHADLEATEQTLKASRETSKVQIAGLETSLQDSTEKIVRSVEESRTLEQKLSRATQEHSVQANKHAMEIQRLERELKSSKAETKTHKDTAIRFAEDLRIARDGHKATKSELQTTRERLFAEEKLHAKAKETIGKIATLAEDLKIEKRELERSLVKERQARTQAEASVKSLSSETAFLRQELDELKVQHQGQVSDLCAELSERTSDLEASNQSLERLQMELKETEQTIRESSLEQISLKAHLSAMESGRHDLLERQSELEESLEEIHDDLNLANEEIASVRDQLEKAVVERDTLRSQRAAYLQSHEREAELEIKLAAQKEAFEDRLRDIHTILGLKFTTAVRTEVKTIIHKTTPLVEQMPKSFRAPLLQQQHVKSA